MNWLDVFCFISAARTRSFSVTARELMISQQAVSRHIQNLEKETGLRLFLRNYHEIHLTKAGERMLQCLVHREHMVRAFKQSIQDQGEVLRVAWSQWLGCPDTIRVRLCSYCDDHPDKTILMEELEDSEIQRCLTEQRFDLLLTTRFSLNQLNLPMLSTVVTEEPLYLLTTSQTDLSGFVPSPHIEAPAGNETEDELGRRIRAEYAGMELSFQQLELTDNPRSVYINVLLRNGIAFTVSRPMLTQNPRFSLHPLKRTVSVVLCRSLRPAASGVRELEEYILQGKEVQV